jgi:hypothetical protein
MKLSLILENNICIHVNRIFGCIIGPEIEELMADWRR